MDRAVLVCKECSVRYCVEREAIGITGRKVKCINCGYIWYQDPIVDDARELEQLKKYVEQVSEADTAERFKSKISQENVRLPNIINTNNNNSNTLNISFLAKIFSPTMIMLIIISSFVLYPQYFYSYIPSIYEKVGLYNTEDLSLANIKVKSRTRNNRIDVVMVGNIINNSADTKPIPQFKAVAYNKDNTKLITLYSKKSEEFLEVGAAKEINRRLPQLPNSSKTLIIDIGNPLELRLR